MKKKILFMIATVLSSSTIFTACSTIVQESDKNTNEMVKTVDTLLPQAEKPLEAENISPVKINDGVFVAEKSIFQEHGDDLPVKWEKSNGFVIRRSESLSLREISSLITEATGIPVVVAAYSPPGSSNQTNNITSPQANNASAADATQNGNINAALTALSGNSISGSPNLSINSSILNMTDSRMPAKFTGSLSDYLNMVSSYFDVSWKYENDKITIQQVITKTYSISSIANIMKINFDLTSQSSTNGSTSNTSSGQNSTTESIADITKEIQDTMKTLVGNNGSFSIDSVSGVVTVTANPSVVKRVEDYLKIINDKLSKQIAVSVKVYTVTLNKQDEFDLDVAGIFKNAGSSGINIGNVASSGTVPSVGGLASGGSGLGWALLNTNSKWAGSNALFQALSTQGDVSVVTTASVTTTNGIPVPLQVGGLRDYVSKVSTETTDTGTTTSIDTDSVSTGFNLHVLPKVQTNGDILLQYGINISELTGANDGFDTFTTNGSTVQLRRLDQRNFIQQARIPNGDTLILAGFEQVKNTTQNSGVGHPKFLGLGGTQSSKVQRQIVVISITPILLQKN